MVQITEQDISRVQKILLPPGAAFNEERRIFIRSMESRDVIACPGSGKTTALLAKILILASRLPFPDESGVCVLTHTNVAIDEIKKAAGAAADLLFKHPNFFGTIQSFVDRFLAIPFYRNEYRRAPQSIDTDLFSASVAGLYNKTKKAQFRLPFWKGDALSVGFLWTSPEDLTISHALQEKFSRLKATEETFGEVVSIRKKLLLEGILSYQDAYSLAIRYLHQFPEVVKAIQARFGYVFIDEMQDTDSHQLQVLNPIFDPEKVIIQCLGDPNQAIYHTDVREEMLWSPRGNPPIHFSDTMRYGQTITHMLDTVRTDRQVSLLPNTQRNSLRPHLLTYAEGGEVLVLPAFARLLRDLKLHALHPRNFKAVGWVGKDKTEDGKTCLCCYLPEYRQSMQKRKLHFGNLLSYLHIQTTPKNQCQGTSLSHNAILAGIAHAISVAGQINPENGHRFTGQTFTRYLRKANEPLCNAFLQSLSEWILDYHRGTGSPETLRDAVAKFVRERFIQNETGTVAEFLDSDEMEFRSAPKKNSNTFVSEDGLEIVVGTVHSVKGETHTATLFLETFNYALDSKRLLPFFEGKYVESDSKKSRHIQNLKVAHVALSRPTHLAAFACSKTNIVDHVAALEDNGWVIRDVTDILNRGG